MAAAAAVPFVAPAVKECSTSLPTSLPPSNVVTPLPVEHRGQTPLDPRRLTKSPLLRLPPELRTLIYAYLTPAQTISYPLGPNTAISALSHRPPPRALLLTCRLLACEALDHFYRVARFRIMLNPPAPLADPHFQRLAHLPQLRRIRNLAVLLDWDLPKVPSYARDAGAAGFEFGLEVEVPFFRHVMDRGRCADMMRLAKRLVGVLDAARELRGLCVSWTDLVEGYWDEKKAVLEVLAGALSARGVKVVRGDIIASNEKEAQKLFDGWEVAAEGRR